MKITHRDIPKFQEGKPIFNLDNWINQNKSYYDWYTTIYPNAQKLMGNPLQQRNDNWNKEQLSSSHYTTDDLRRSAYNNYLYTGDYNARHSDLQHWANSLQDLNNISDQDLVNRYNTIAGRIRAAREAPQTYNTHGYTGTNRDFRSIFESRSKQGTNNPDYVIGYQENLDNIEGTSTWQRRMDRYQTKFEDDTEEGKKNRIFYIKRPNGTTIKVYKKENGDIALFNGPQTPLTEGGPTVERPSGPISEGVKIPDEIETGEKDGNKTPVGHRQYGFDWNKVGKGFRNLLNNPNLYSLGRLAWNIASNDKIYGEQLKGIKPVLKDPYLTHRQVVGDEATKQAYYRRAAEGQTKAARPFTSDADRQMAYQMEAKRVGDELRAQGDLADNQEIRRTSDESNQHQWANTERANQVANYNAASINQANALQHNLRAQWRAANGSSVDNALKEIQYGVMKKQAEEDAYNDQIFALQQQQELLNNPKILEARKEYQNVLNKHKLSDGSYDEYNDEVIAAKQKYQAAQLQLAIENKEKWRAYKNRGIFFVKNGSKITRKVKDNMLYMSTRDVVKHFREMTKLSSDAQNRKQPKIERLASHPKGSTRRYQQGGVAPFMVYTPITLGGETTTSSESSTSSTKTSSKDTSAKDSLDFVKELFKELAGKGLQIDVNTVYSQFNNMFQKARLFGDELSTEDIQLMYLSAISKVNEIQRSKDIYDKAKSYATTNDALNEYAVTADGQYVVQDTKTGKVSFTKDLSELPKDKALITNQHLLYLREYSPQLLLGQGNFIVENVVNNGMGINKIGAAIKALAGNISSTTSKIEGLSEVQSKQVKSGVQLLAQTDGTPDGIYQVTTTNKNSSAQISAALDYIENMLSPSQRAILNAHGGTKPLIASFVASQTGSTLEQSITPVTGKASKNNNGKNGTDGDIKSNFLDQLQRDQIGIDREFSMVTKDGPSKLYSLNSKYISQLPNVGEDMNLNEMLDKSKIGSIMDSRLGVTFGDQVINPNDFKDIMFDLGGGATVVTLPCKYENGHKVVNFAIKDEFDNAVKEVSKTVPIDYSNPTFVKALSEKLHEKGLDSLLSGDSLDPNMLGHFLVVSAYTTDKVNINTNSRYIEKVKNPDKSLEERLIKGLSTNKDKNDYELDIDDKWGLFELTYDDVYRGSVFIPLNNDPVSAQTGWGNDNIKLDEARDLAEQYQNYQKSLTQKDSSSRNLYERE